jgi:hypothetical protein
MFMYVYIYQKRESPRNKRREVCERRTHQSEILSGEGKGSSVSLAALIFHRLIVPAVPAVDL